MGSDEYHELRHGLADYYSDPSAGGKHLPPERQEEVYWEDLHLMMEMIPYLHEHAAGIESDQYPDAVLKLHTYQHLAEVCIFASGKLEGPYDGWRLHDELVYTAECNDNSGEDLSTALAACVDRVLPEVNARHQWKLKLIITDR